MNEIIESKSSTNWVINTNEPIKMLTIKPQYNISFHNSNGVVGKLEFENNELVFTGNADEAALLFIKNIGNYLSEKMTDYETALKHYEHIISEGGMYARDTIKKWTIDKTS